MADSTNTSTSTQTAINGGSITQSPGSNSQAINVPVDTAAKTLAEFYKKQADADRNQRSFFFAFYLAQLAASIFATVEAYRAYKKYLNRQESLLAFQQRSAEMLDARYNAHFAPVEDAYMDELGAMGPYVPRYQMVSDLMRQGAIRSFDLSKEVILKTRTRYCAGLTGHQLKQITIARAQAESDAVSMAYRYEDAIENARNMDRHNKRINMFQVGRNLNAQALQTAGSTASAYGVLANGAQAGLNQGISGIFSSVGSIISNRSSVQTGGAATAGVSGGFQSPNSFVGNTGINLPSYGGGFTPENAINLNYGQQGYDFNSLAGLPSLSAGLGV